MGGVLIVLKLKFRPQHPLSGEMSGVNGVDREGKCDGFNQKDPETSSG